MQFSRLRLTGFKSFVETADFSIEPGLTGVVGPNGCGKSNLVEALRWVMGESSFKSMRGSGMDDVIFAGGGARPARNHAEVGLSLDNTARAAPAAFNGDDTIEVTRRIERGQGSTYRINGREVRARDVQILFADASTGARSPSLVRQGQVAEIIAARPQARRRVLEEAAGVAGLHGRRHEAELRLKAAEENLARLDDVLGQIAGQGDGLRRQARQAQRYREVQAEIRRHQALASLIEHEAAKADRDATAAAAAKAADALVEATRLQGEAARAQAVAAHGLPRLREAETAAGEALRKEVVAREALDGEERRAKARRAELDRRLREIGAEQARDQAALNDAAAVLERLAQEEAELAEAGESAEQAEALRATIAEATAEGTAVQARLAHALAERAALDAERRALAESMKVAEDRLARCRRDSTLAQDHAATVRRAAEETAELDAAARRLAQAAATRRAAEAEAGAAGTASAASREAEAATRARLAGADRRAAELEAEVRTLGTLLDTGTGRWAGILEGVTVTPGFELALGAALGDDLAASSDPEAPTHWIEVPGADDPSLPPGVSALLDRVAAPAAMRRRLAQIGIVADRSGGDRFAAALAAGQILVTVAGDVWRWDGLRRKAGAPTPAARRLADLNRLASAREELDAARTFLAGLSAAAADAERTAREAAGRDAAARTADTAARRLYDQARSDHAALERRQADAVVRLDAAEAAVATAASARDEAAARHCAVRAALSALPSTAALDAAIESGHAAAAHLRRTDLEARSALAAREKVAQARTRRSAAIADERASWVARQQGAAAHRAELEARAIEAEADRKTLLDAPDRFASARRRVLSGVQAAEAHLRAASDARASGENALRDADGHARATLEAMAAAREGRARCEAVAEASAQRLVAVAQQIAAELDCAPAALPGLAGLEAGAPRPDAGTVAARLDALKADRERLGAVNLRAENELAELEGKRLGLDKERAELGEAVRRLRQAIAGLNREGRERLMGAFGRVDAHFRELFTTLFGGGTAELQLVESDDPLEAGLEIMARPPGKKPQVMTLLSGGEQALTAISLIFAVFLTNPSPICVLDEVDAPLDDANVDRFYDLLDAIRRRTQTRFIAITHNPVAMARMDRLFGVTQAERGVSQLVSVDLVDAERMLETSG